MMTYMPPLPLSVSPVTTSQTGPHPGLKERLRRHRQSPWRQPVRAHTRVAFEHFYRAWKAVGEPRWLLDAGCGTGESTRLLAGGMPEFQVLGIDRSLARLTRGLEKQRRQDLRRGVVVEADGCWLLRAEFADFWRLCLEHECRPQKLYFYYPNPWPKSRHLGRRWHGHPVFPLLAGVSIEMRCNWQIYAEEFAIALGELGQSVKVESWYPESGFVSPFERKYALRGQRLWRVSTGGKAISTQTR